MRPGERKLQEVIQRQRTRARTADPRPYDDDWGWWVEGRLHRLEDGQRWLIRLAGAALATQVIRVLGHAAGIL